MRAPRRVARFAQSRRSQIFRETVVRMDLPPSDANSSSLASGSSDGGNAVRKLIVAVALLHVAAGCNAHAVGDSFADGGDAMVSDGSLSDIPDGADVDGGSDGNCLFEASGYDQSCAVDTDCTAVTPGNYCAADCLVQCSAGAVPVNNQAASTFRAAVANTPVGSGALRVNCGCPIFRLVPFPCCRSGSCTWDCTADADTLATCADAGGTCTFAGPGASLMPCGTCNGCRQPGGVGPSNSCAHSDEVCCLPFGP